MQPLRIALRGADLGLGKRLTHRVAPRDTDGVKIEGVGAVFWQRRRLYRGTGKAPGVLRRYLLPSGDVIPDGTQLEAQQRRLDFVEAAVHADFGVNKGLHG